MHSLLNCRPELGSWRVSGLPKTNPGTFTVYFLLSVNLNNEKQFKQLAVNQRWPPCPSTGVTVHAAVCSVCDPQPGRLNALLPERTDGQVYAHLPGRQALSSASC